MNVTRTDHTTTDPERCRMCHQPTDHPMYCSSACKQRAYRRRVADRRLARASDRRKTEAEQHRNEWCRFLIDSASMSRKQAERTYTALMSIDRLDGPPYEQMSF